MIFYDEADFYDAPGGGPPLLEVLDAYLNYSLSREELIEMVVACETVTLSAHPHLRFHASRGRAAQHATTKTPELIALLLSYIVDTSRSMEPGDGFLTNPEGSHIIWADWPSYDPGDLDARDDYDPHHV